MIRQATILSLIDLPFNSIIFKYDRPFEHLFESHIIQESFKQKYIRPGFIENDNIPFMVIISRLTKYFHTNQNRDLYFYWPQDLIHPHLTRFQIAVIQNYLYNTNYTRKVKNHLYGRVMSYNAPDGTLDYCLDILDELNALKRLFDRNPIYYHYYCSSERSKLTTDCRCSIFLEGIHSKFHSVYCEPIHNVFANPTPYIYLTSRGEEFYLRHLSKNQKQVEKDFDKYKEELERPPSNQIYINRNCYASVSHEVQWS
jgi:hypothetical protein